MWGLGCGWRGKDGVEDNRCIYRTEHSKIEVVL